MTTPSRAATGNAISNATAGALSVPYPASPASGQLYLLQIHSRATVSTSAVMRAPDVWTLIKSVQQLGSTATGYTSVWAAISSGGETGSVVVSCGGAWHHLGRMYAIANARVSDGVAGAYDSLVGSYGTSQGITMPTLTCASAECLAVAMIAATDDNAMALAATGETGGNWNDLVTVISSAGSDGALYWQASSLGVGTIADGVSSMNASDPWGYVALIVIPQTAVVPPQNYERSVSDGIYFLDPTPTKSLFSTLQDAFYFSDAPMRSMSPGAKGDGIFFWEGLDSEHQTAGDYLLLSDRWNLTRALHIVEALYLLDSVLLTLPPVSHVRADSDGLYLQSNALKTINLLKSDPLLFGAREVFIDLSKLIQEGLYVSDKMRKDVLRLVMDMLLLSDEAKRASEYSKKETDGVAFSDQTFRTEDMAVPADIILLGENEYRTTAKTIQDDLLLRDTVNFVRFLQLTDWLFTSDSVSISATIVMFYERLVQEGLYLEDSRSMSRLMQIMDFLLFLDSSNTSANQLYARLVQDYLPLPDTIGVAFLLDRRIIDALSLFDSVMTNVEKKVTVQDQLVLADLMFKDHALNFEESLDFYDALKKIVEVSLREGMLIGDTVSTFKLHIEEALVYALLQAINPLGLKYAWVDPLGIYCSSNSNILDMKPSHNLVSEVRA